LAGKFLNFTQLRVVWDEAFWHGTLHF